MPHISITVESHIDAGFRAHQVAGIFDLPAADASKQTFEAEVPSLDEPWKIGAIVGPSGSGKTTIARAAFSSAVIRSRSWRKDKAVIDGFGNAPIQQVVHTLTAVGFGAPPAWLRPYSVLSRGEQFRCDLARALLSGRPLVVCDEFTSVVDRTVAKISSAALAKTLRSGASNKRFVAVTCHLDVLDWLEPDWTVDMATGELTRGRLRRPAIPLVVARVRQRAWQLFARHHYLSGGLPRGATCFAAFWNSEPVAFCAVVGMLGHRGHKRITRLVTLPDFQGVGIGTRLLDFICQRVRDGGDRVSITTSHPAMCAHLAISSHWRLTSRRSPHHHKRQFIRDARVIDSFGRATESFEFQS